MDLDLLALDPDDAGVLGVRAADQAHGLGPARAHQAREAQDLALAELKGDILHVAGHQALGLQHHRRTRRHVGFALGLLVDHAAHHHLHHLVDGHRGGVHGIDILAVPHDGDPVGDLLELIHPVGDIDDAHAGGLQAADKDEQILDFALGQGGGGLIHNEDFRIIVGESLGNLHHLLLGYGGALAYSGGRDAQMRRIQQLLGHLVLLGLVEE